MIGMDISCWNMTFLLLTYTEQWDPGVEVIHDKGRYFRAEIQRRMIGLDHKIEGLKVVIDLRCVLKREIRR